jgi:two-component system, LuxR family, sensor kinase FixL
LKVALSKIIESIGAVELCNVIAEAMLLVNDGTIIFANNAALTMLAYTQHEIIGLDVDHLVPEATRKKHLSYRKQFAKKPENRAMGRGENLIAITKDGRELPVDISLSTLLIEGQQLVLVMFHTIVKQVKAEASLVASEERLRLAKASAGLGVVDISLSSKQVQYDEIVGKIFGLVRKLPIDYDDFIDFLDENDQEKWREVITDAAELNRDKEFTFECRVNNRLKNNQRWIHIAGKVFLKNGIPERILGVIQNVTEYKLLQQKISKQRIELEALANKQIAIQTASAIAHEINQPLAAISAYSEVALYALKAERLDTDRLTRSLTGCVTQAQRAGNSLHELMEFLQKGKIEAIPLDLNKIVHEAINITRHHGYEAFETTLNLDPLLPKVLANETQLQKVLVNLLRNGVEAVHSAGIPFANIKVNVQTHAVLNFAEVIIQDNGPGLSKEAINRIFEPFFTTKSHGIGMGLAISRTLVEACGGSLWFDANSKAGAIFHLTLPFADQ